MVVGSWFLVLGSWFLVLGSLVRQQVKNQGQTFLTGGVFDKNAGRKKLFPKKTGWEGVSGIRLFRPARSLFEPSDWVEKLARLLL